MNVTNTIFAPAATSSAGLTYRGTFDRTTAPAVLLGNSIYLFDLDPSTGQTGTRLPAATGSGARVVVGINGLIQPFIMRVQPGEKLNDVTDGTMSANIMTYGNVVRMEFIDVGVGSWHGVTLNDVGSTPLQYAQWGSRTPRLTTGNVEDYLTADIIGLSTVPGAVVANGTLTVANDGLYRFDIAVEAANNSTGDNNLHFTSFNVTRNGGAPTRFSSLTYSPEMRDNVDRTHYVGFGFIELNAGDTVRFSLGADAGNTPANQQDLFNYDVMAAQQPVSMVVDPGLVPVTPLHHLGMALVAPGIIVAPGGILSWTDANWTKNDPNGLVSAAGITIQNTSFYEFALSAGHTGTTANATLELRKNGATIAQSYGAVSTLTDFNNGLVWSGPLVAGDVLTIHQTGNANASLRSPSLTLQQLPTASVVQVPAALVDYLSGYCSTSPSVAVNQAIPFNVVNGNMTIAAGLITLKGGKTYRIKGSVSGSISGGAIFQWMTAANVGLTGGSMLAAQNSNSASYELTYTPAVDTQIKLAPSGNTVPINGPLTSFSITQIGSSSVSTVPVNDQASSGYFDIGTMRIQWGFGTSTGANQTLTFPAPFANGSYAFSGAGTSGVHLVLSAITRTAANVLFSVLNNLAGQMVAGQTFSWFAIGIKP